MEVLVVTSVNVMEGSECGREVHLPLSVANFLAAARSEYESCRRTNGFLELLPVRCVHNQYANILL